MKPIPVWILTQNVQKVVFIELHMLYESFNSYLISNTENSEYTRLVGYDFYSNDIFKISVESIIRVSIKPSVEITTHPPQLLR